MHSEYSSIFGGHVLLHACCGPCSIAPVQHLRAEGYAVAALFVNPNIHPLSEYLRRREAMQQCAERLALPVIWRDDVWDVTAWLRQVADGHDTGEARCRVCYTSRLEATARMAAEKGFSGFTSSLLYSRHQRHEEIACIAREQAEKWGTTFLYQDFRGLWQEGIDISKEWGVYRQAYCGCIYSEAERYARKLKKICSKA